MWFYVYGICLCEWFVVGLKLLMLFGQGWVVDYVCYVVDYSVVVLFVKLGRIEND